MSIFKDLKFRCSSLGHLMTDPKGKSPMECYNDSMAQLNKVEAEYAAIANKETITAKKKLDKISSLATQTAELFNSRNEIVLSESAKTHLVDVFVANKFNRHTDIQSKYILKGNMCEDDSITLYSRVTGDFFIKNEERLSNDFIQGTPDLYKGESIKKASEVIDIKTSWDIYTFFRVLTKPVSDLYWWQLQGYMQLTGANEAVLAYCLVDTPQVMINDAKRALFYKMGVTTEENSDFVEACDEIDRNMTFGDIPLSQRVITFRFQKDESELEKLYARIEKARTFLMELEEKVNKNQLLIA